MGSERGRFRLKTRQAGEPPTHEPYRHNLAIGAASYTEGDTLTWTYTLDRRGYTPTGADPAETIKFRLPATATANENEFTASLLTRLQAADAATSGAAYLLIASEHTFSFDNTFAGTLTITWTSNNDGVAEGNQIAGLEIYGPSSGSLTNAIATATLVDTGAVAAPQVLLSLSTHDEGIAAGTLVGLLSVINGTGAAYNTYSLSNTAGNRYAIDGADNHRLEIGATAAVAGTYAIAGTATNGTTPLTFNFAVTALPVAGVDTELFNDSFDRGSENLDVSAIWDLQAGTASKITVSGNEVRTSSGTDTFDTMPDLATINHYAEGPVAAVSNKPGFMLIRFVDVNNLAGVRLVTSPSTQLEIWTRIAGTWTLAATFAGSPVVGNMLRVEARDDIISVKLAGTLLGSYTLSPAEMTVLDNGTKVGLCNSTGSGQFLQSFAAGALGPLVPPAPLMLLSANQLTEASAQGTGIGTFSITNGNGTYVITLTNNQGNRFQVAGTGGTLLQAGSVATDFEAQNSWIITASATNGVDAPTVQQFTINILDALETPPTSQPLDPNAFYLRVDSAAGTVVGALNLPGQTITGRSIVSQSGIRAYNAPYSDAVFAISGSNLIVASGRVADFDGGPWSGSTDTFLPSGLPFYNITIRYTVSGGSTIDKAYKIRRQDNVIAPTGDQTNNVYTVNTLSVNTVINETTKTGGLRALCTSSVGNRTIVIDPATIGTHEINSNSFSDLVAGNLTIKGHRRSIQFRDFMLRVYGATNVIMRDMVFAAGGDQTGRALSDDRDSLQFSAGQNVLTENCDIRMAYDELTSAGLSWQPPGSGKPPIKNLRFSRNFWYLPGWAPVHTSEPNELSHPYGVLMNDYCNHIVGDKNIIMGCQQRTPISYRNWSSLWQNNLLIYGGDSGTGWSKHEDPGNKSYGTYIHRNNLHRPAHSFSSRNKCFASWRAIAGDMEVKEYGNHFVGAYNVGSYASYGFAPDPVVRSTDTILRSGATLGIYVDYMPFLPAPEMDAQNMPTDTAAQIQALFYDIVNYVGCRARDGSGNLLPGLSNMTKIGAYILSNFLAGTTPSLTPTGTNKYNNSGNTTSLGENTGTFNVIPIPGGSGGIPRINFPNDLVSGGIGSGGWDTGLPP